MAEMIDAAPTPEVSYVMPVLNEANYIREAVASILGQQYSGGKEIILALGPSTDDTTAIVEAMAARDARVRFVHNPQSHTPIGLNLAIRASRNPVVIRVDAHSILDPEYTKHGVATLMRTDAADVGGLMNARGRNPLQRAVAAAYNSRYGMGGAPYHSGASEGQAESAYLGIFRRSIFDEIGYYDESLWRGQDWEFCLRIRKAGHVVWFDPELSTVYYPREDFRSLAAQSYASGVWRGELARRYSEGKSFRHLVPPVALLASALGCASWLAPLGQIPLPAKALLGLFRLAPVAYAMLVGYTALTMPDLSPKERGLLAKVLPTIHFPWAAGFIRGRLRGSGETTDAGRATGHRLVAGGQ
ncbi:glycosyltransferase family 2 protein [Arthrobacter sp. 179]|uniref:glycosyltransferase family 2 protein n=1 Tax=Arthrobacter sp. 179 TaxID=3457734 RepID=UPI004033E88D